MLVIDDAQHADEGLVGFVQHLLGVGGFACFVVLLARPGLLERQPGLATDRRASVVHLGDAERRDMAALVDGLVAGLPAACATGLVERAEGVPLYAVETVRSLIDRDSWCPAAVSTCWQTPTRPRHRRRPGLAAGAGARPGSTPCRPTGAASSTGRACSGRPYPRADRAPVPRGRPISTPCSRRWSATQILSQEANRFSAELGQYRFVQAAVRQVAYGTIARRDRKAAHLAVAALLETRRDARASWRRSSLSTTWRHRRGRGRRRRGTALSALAVGHLKRAAVRASALGSPAEAAGHLRVALDAMRRRA